MVYSPYALVTGQRGLCDRAHSARGVQSRLAVLANLGFAVHLYSGLAAGTPFTPGMEPGTFVAVRAPCRDEIRTEQHPTTHHEIHPP